MTKIQKFCFLFIMFFSFVLVGVSAAPARADVLRVDAAYLNAGYVPEIAAGDEIYVIGTTALDLDGWDALNAIRKSFSLTLGEGQTLIPANAMQFNSYVTDVYAGSVTRIDKMAFMACAALENAEFPAAESVENDAFNTCPELWSVDMPRAENVGANAFAGCSRLYLVSLDSVRDVESRAFANCVSLPEVTLPAAEVVGSFAFSGCSALRRVTLPYAEDVELRAFYDCYSLREATLSSVEFIGSEAFAGCESLEDLYLYDADPSVTAGAFDGVPPGLVIYSNRHRLSDPDYPYGSYLVGTDEDDSGSGGCNASSMNLMGWGFLCLLLMNRMKKYEKSS
jgi:hypothetical protein